jgi:hypothetical protein
VLKTRYDVFKPKDLIHVEFSHNTADYRRFTNQEVAYNCFVKNQLTKKARVRAPALIYVRLVFVK